MNIQKTSAYLLFICSFILIVIGVPRLVLNTWLPYSNYLFFFALAVFVLSMALNYKLLFSFFRMKTTKYGFSMGSLILMGLVLYLSFNFLATRYDWSKDITQDRLNSLSLESHDILDEIQEPILFKALYQGDNKAGSNIGLKLLLKKYSRVNSGVEVRFVDAYRDPEASSKLGRQDKGRTVLFVKIGEKEERVSEPISEETITSALYRAYKNVNAVLYFLEGHGERSIEQQDGTGLSLLVKNLKEKAFQLKGLNLLESTRVPRDASMVAIVGPKKNLLEEEIKALKDYLREGGRLFVAQDPQNEADLSALTEEFGLKINKNYILTTQSVAGGDALAIVGQDFSDKSDITQRLEKNSMVLFYEAAEVTRVDSAESNKVQLLLKSLPTMLKVKSLKSYREEVKGKTPGALQLAMSSRGKVSHDGHNHGPEETVQDFFYLVATGDSDFLTNSYFETAFNKDLALNIFAALSGEVKLISIHPKLPAKTKLLLTSSYSAFIIIFPIVIPLVLLVFASVLWFRRRSA